MGDTRTIETKLYLDVLAQMPEVSAQDLEKTREVLTAAFGALPERIVFDRDFEPGDGIITATATVPSGDGTMRRARFFLNETGSLSSAETSFRQQLPYWSGALFFSGIFGRSETTSLRNQPVDLNAIAAGTLRLYRMMPDPGETTPPPFRSGYLPELSEAATALYAAASRSRSVEASRQSVAMRALNVIKTRIAEQEGRRQQVMAETEARYARMRAIQQCRSDIDAVFQSAKTPLSYARNFGGNTSTADALVASYKRTIEAVTGPDELQVMQQRLRLAREMWARLQPLISDSLYSAHLRRPHFDSNGSQHSDRGDRGGGGRWDRSSGGSSGGDRGYSISRDRGGR